MFCKQCGKQIADSSHFCCFCGFPADDVAASMTQEQPSMDTAFEALPDSGTVPVIGELSPEAPVISPEPPAETPEPEPVVPVWEDIPSDIPDLEESVGTYEEIMAEFSTRFYVPPREPEPKPQPPQPKPRSQPRTAAQKTSSREARQEQPAKDSGGSSKRGLLIMVSVLLILALLIGVTILCIRALIPDPQEEPILSEQVESMVELPETPSAEPEEAVISQQEASVEELPYIAPPETDAETTDTETSNAEPHDASEGNTTVVGSRFVDNVPTGANFRSAPEQHDGNVISELPVGTEVGFIEEYNSQYSKVFYDDTYGYVATQYLSEALPNLTVSGTVYVTNVEDFAYFRSSPEIRDDNIISQLYLDQALEYIETTDNNYVKVKKDDSYGYVHEDYITFTAPNTSSNIIMYVTGVNNGAYFLSHPKQGSTVLATLPPNTTVGFIENSTGGYCKVIYGDQVGYILGDYLTETNPNEQANEDARETLLAYSLEKGFTCYSFLDMNGDGIEEMLGSKSQQKLDSLLVSSSATVLAYENGKVVEKGVLNPEGGDSPMFHIKNADGTHQVVTESYGKNKYACTFYTLDREGNLNYEAWSVEFEDGVNKYYIDRNGDRQETSEEAHNTAVKSPDYYYVVYQEQAT